ncbi:MAG: hypothetical protein FRX48_02006 [Lasallia pustulata]|uniref:Methyltransferase n=1 Tax=Lasallia pustulata TaxID=136370 RepID=A0A5M8PVG6_9LECA|nr:MAG: hypothetical protein FRX48_02006 [Lasallia pustulata]
MEAYDDDDTATFHYITWKDLYLREKPFQLFIDIPANVPDQRKTNIEFERKEVGIQDIRENEGTFNLDSHGFLVRRSSTLSSFEDLNTTSVESTYLPAVEKFLRAEVEGVDRVFFFDWRLRSASTPAVKSIVNLKDHSERLGPAMYVHVDQAPVAALNRVKTQLANEADYLLQGRVRILNIWRPLRHPVEDWPLAVCDGSTVDTTDLVETDTVRRDYVGSNMFVLHQERHKWYYLSKHNVDEVLVLKQFDSSPDVDARYCPHAAFKHRNVTAQTPARESVEVRALVFTYPR